MGLERLPIMPIKATLAMLIAEIINMATPIDRPLYTPNTIAVAKGAMNRAAVRGMDIQGLSVLIPNILPIICGRRKA